MTHYTATYQPTNSRWELRTPGQPLAVAYNCDVHPMDAKGAIDWVRWAVTAFDTAPDHVECVSHKEGPTIHATTATAEVTR